MVLSLNRPTPRRELEPLEPGERAIHEMLDRMYDEARAFKERLEPDWVQNIEYLRGEQWVKPRPSGLTQVTDNQLWRIYQQQASLLTDTKPNITVTAAINNAVWQQIIKEIRDAIEAVWFENEVDRVLVRCILDLFVTSKAYLKCIWNRDLAFGLGDVGIARIPPKYLWPDPNSTSLDTAEFICYRTPVSLWDIRRRFDPIRAAQVKPDASLSKYTESKVRYKIPLPLPRRKEQTRESAIPKAWVEEWWVRDPAADLAGRPKYPTGRMITRAGRILLFDAPNPYWDPWPGPWIDFSVNQMEESPYGEPDITQMKGMQDAVNVLLSLIIDNARFITNGIWIMDEDALSPTESRKLISRPGAVITKRPGRELRRDVGQSLPGQVLEVLNALKMDLQFISGLQDTGYGRPPKGVTAASAIDQLQLATQATIRLKAREIEAGLVRLGHRIVARIFQYYLDERVMDVQGAEGIQSIKWDPGVFGRLDRFRGPEDALPDAPESYPAISEDDRRELLKQFRVRVLPASSLALSKEKRWAMDLALYSAGLIDRKAVLDSMDYPNKDAIMQRMTQAQAESASNIAKGAAGATPRGRGVNVTQKIVGR